MRATRLRLWHWLQRCVVVGALLFCLQPVRYLCLHLTACASSGLSAAHAGSPHAAVRVQVSAHAPGLGPDVSAHIPAVTGTPAGSGLPHHTHPFLPLYAYVLTATWVPERLANAQQLCAAFPPRVCKVSPAPQGDLLTPADLDSFQHQQLISLAQPPRPWGISLPRPLRPLGVEHDSNQMVVSHRAHKAVGNTVGIIRILQHMAATAAAADTYAASHGEATAPSGSMTFVLLEDDAQLAEPVANFTDRLQALLSLLPRNDWHAVSLTPPPGMCSRARRLPWFPRRTGVVAATFSFSRTTALVLNIDGVSALLAALPATNTVDLWIRQAVRARKLRMRIHCGVQDADLLMAFSDVSNRQV
jgi:hypothetical protein